MDISPHSRPRRNPYSSITPPISKKAGVPCGARVLVWHPGEKARRAKARQARLMSSNPTSVESRPMA